MTRNNCQVTAEWPQQQGRNRAPASSPFVPVCAPSVMADLWGWRVRSAAQGAATAADVKRTYGTYPKHAGALASARVMG